jgi:hypothetical protein
VTTYETALYGPDGKLVKTAKAYPPGPEVGPQECAERMARAADEGCTYSAGAYLVWESLPDRAPDHIDDAPEPDGSKPFGFG